MNQTSERAFRVLTRIVSDRIQGPDILYAAWASGEIGDADLAALVPDTWLYMDWPEQVLGAARWVQMFRAGGFISIPYGQPRPMSAMTVFRGAAPGRNRGMSWTQDVNRATQFQQRHAWFGPAALYQATVSPDAVLALLERKGEGLEVVVDPDLLGETRRLGPIRPQRQRVRA